MTVAIKYLIKIEMHSEIGCIDNIFRYYGSTPGYTALLWLNCNTNIYNKSLFDIIETSIYTDKPH